MIQQTPKSGEQSPNTVESGGKEVAVGDWVRDAEGDDSKMLVVECFDIPADEFGILQTQSTVAEENPGYPADDPVVKVVFYEGLNYYLDGWSVEEVLDKAVRANGKLGDTRISAYSYPLSRVTPIQ